MNGNPILKLDPDAWYTRRQIQDGGGPSVKTQERLAQRGEGPQYVKSGPNGSAISKGSWVLNWFEKRAVRSTTDTPEAA